MEKLNGIGIAQDMFRKVMIGLCGKYAKQCMADIERTGELSPRVRKAILDSFGDMRREIEKTA